jgi:hypothetical protein
MSASIRSMVALLTGVLGGCGASAPDDGGGGDGEAQPDAGEVEEQGDPDSGPVPVVMCQGVASSLGLVGALDTTFGYYRDGEVNDQYRFGGKTGNDLIDVTLWQNREPFEDGTVEPVEFELKETDDFFGMGIWVLIFPDVDFEGDIADLTGVNPTFAATRARVSVTTVSTTTAVATVENASFVEVDYALEPVEGGCTTEIASFSINVPTFVE